MLRASDPGADQPSKGTATAAPRPCRKIVAHGLYVAAELGPNRSFVSQELRYRLTDQRVAQSVATRPSAAANPVQNPLRRMIGTAGFSVSRRCPGTATGSMGALWRSIYPPCQAAHSQPTAISCTSALRIRLAFRQAASAPAGRVGVRNTVTAVCVMAGAARSERCCRVSACRGQALGANRSCPSPSRRPFPCPLRVGDRGTTWFRVR
jgi:hypothetical protein